MNSATGTLQQEGVQWAIALPSGSGPKVATYLIPLQPTALPMPKSRGRKARRKNRAPATACAKRSGLDNFNNTPQVFPVFRRSPAQGSRPPANRAPHQEAALHQS